MGPEAAPWNFSAVMFYLQEKVKRCDVPLDI